MLNLEKKTKEDLKEAFEYSKKYNIKTIHNLDKKLYNYKKFKDLHNKLLDAPKSINFDFIDNHIF